MPDFSKALRQLRPGESAQRRLFQSENPVSSLVRQLAFMKSDTLRRSVGDTFFAGTEEVTPLGRHLVISQAFAQAADAEIVTFDRALSRRYRSVRVACLS
jgi:hypothetical protein